MRVEIELYRRRYNLRQVTINIVINLLPLVASWIDEARMRKACIEYYDISFGDNSLANIKHDGVN